MLDTYNIQIFETAPKPDSIFKMKFQPVLDTALIVNFTDHKSIITEVNKLFDKENIDKENKQFLIYIDTFDNNGCKGGVKYLFNYNINSILTKVQIQRQYYKEFVNVGA